jgi:hypothetical protein
MKIILMFSLVFILGCSHLKRVEVDYLYPLEPETAKLVLSLVKKTPTFVMLNERAKHPLIEVEEEQAGWVWVSIYSVGQDFASRWATLKVDAQSGLVLKLETGENLEDKWIVEYDPKDGSR